MFDVTERVLTGLYLHDSDNVNSLTSPLHFECFACNECCLLLSAEIDGEFTEFVRKCEELCDMSNKKCSDSVRKEKLWGQISEELKKIGLSFSVFYCSF